MNHSFEQWLEKTTGYRCKTTFWMDFSIADAYGVEAIKDTYRRAMRCWRTSYTYLTELVLVLNHKAWSHHSLASKGERKSIPYVGLYSKLYDRANSYARQHLQDKELEYYLKITA